MSKSIPQLNAITSATTGDLLHIVRSNVDKKILFEDFKNSITSSTNNTVWVDSIYGNNATGALENQARPYQTITAAQTAAVAAGGVWNIQINNGTYSDYNLGATLMNYIFAPGAEIVTNKTCFFDGGVAMVFNVFGYGRFESTSAIATDAILKLTAESIVNFEAISCQSTQLGFSTSNTDAPRMNIKVKDSIYSAGVLISMASSPTNIPVISIDCNIAESELSLISTSGGNDFGTVTLRANKILLNDNATPEYILNQDGGSVNIHGNCYATYVLGFPVIRINAGLSTNFYGNLDINSTVTIDASSGECNIYGDVISYGVSTCSAGGTLILHGKWVNLSVSSSAYAISVTGGILIVKYRVVNEINSATGHGILVSSGTLILDGATIVTTHASAESINAASAKNIKIYYAVANKAMSVNITNIITGTSMIVDTDVS